MWVALLNLENLYGTEESLKKAFERALQYCEPRPVYQQLADIYTDSGKVKVRSSLHRSFSSIRRNVKPLTSTSCLVLFAGGRGAVQDDGEALP